MIWLFMRKTFVLIVLISYFLGFCSACYSSPLSGSVEEQNLLKNPQNNTIIDVLTGKPLQNVQIGIPSQGISTRTDSQGMFSLDANLNGPAILSVNTEGYQPFSMTVTQEDLKKPLIIGLSRNSKKQIIIDSELHHLGDNKFSKNSANAEDFQLQASKPFFSKKFYTDNSYKSEYYILKIGSVIGLDTEMAQRLSQNKTGSNTSSPTQIYLNSQKVGELKINGDSQEVFLPAGSLKIGEYNEISLKTGINLNSLRKVDYDDMEFMNLILEFK